MTAETFNISHGFKLEVEELPYHMNRVHVVDTELHLYTKGIRKGVSKIRTKNLDIYLEDLNNKLMFTILDKVYQ